MVYINLLPVREIKQRVQARQQVVGFSFIFLVLIGLLAVVAVIQSGIVTSLKKELTNLENEKKKYNTVIAQIKEIENKKKMLETRISIIKELDKSSSLPVHVMDDVARATAPDRIWLTDYAQDGGTLTIQGMALDNRTIAAYMEQLKASDYITSVNLSNSSLKGYAGRNLQSFTLSCSVSPLVDSSSNPAEPNKK